MKILPKIISVFLILLGFIFLFNNFFLDYKEVAEEKPNNLVVESLVDVLEEKKVNFSVTNEPIVFNRQYDLEEVYDTDFFRVSYPKGRKVYNPGTENRPGFAFCPVSSCQDSEMSITVTEQTSFNDWLVIDKRLFEKAYWTWDPSKYKLRIFKELTLGKFPGIGFLVTCIEGQDCLAADRYFVVFLIKNRVIEMTFLPDNEIHKSIVSSFEMK